MLPEMKSATMPKLKAAEAEMMLKEYRSGARVPDLTKKYKISETTFYRWKARYEGLTANEIAISRKTEKKARALARRVRIQELEIKALKAALRKKF